MVNNDGVSSNANLYHTEQPTMSATNYASMSTEVLHLLLAQKNLSLSGSRDTLLRRLADHERTATENPPPPTPSVASPNISQFTAESLRALATDLAPLLRDVLVRENVAQPAPSQPAPSQPAPSQPPPVEIPPQNAHTAALDLGNPSQVAALISPPQVPPLSMSSPLESAGLPKKLEDQILNGEFVDFSLLLPGNSDRPNFGPIRLSVEGDQGFSIPIPNFSNSGKRPKIDCIDKWLTAFGIYASVVVERFPHKASQLFAYQRIIREASQKFKGLAWYSYDIAFRKLAAKNPAQNWGERHLQLWLDKFTGLARSICFVCGGADHMSDLCPLSSSRFEGSRPRLPSQRGFCRNFNGGVPCAANPCPFEHRCNRPDCGGRHGAYEHNETSAKRTDDTPRHRKHK
jgi:hypothetical protein